jgi:hypothetical protein
MHRNKQNGIGKANSLACRGIYSPGEAVEVHAE